MSLSTISHDDAAFHSGYEEDDRPTRSPLLRNSASHPSRLFDPDTPRAHNDRRGGAPWSAKGSRCPSLPHTARWLVGLCVAALAGGLVAWRLWQLTEELAAVNRRLSSLQGQALTRQSWRAALPAASTPQEGAHDYPYARTAVASLISLDAVQCQVAYVAYAQLRLLDERRLHDVLLYYATDDDARAQALFDDDPHCSALHHISRLPRPRLQLPSGHWYSAGGLRLLPLPPIEARVKAKGLMPEGDKKAYAMNKLTVFGQLVGVYDGVVMLDADAIAVRSLDAFFALQADVALAFDQEEGCYVKEELTASVYFFRPSRHLALAVEAFLDPAFSVPCSQWPLAAADQSLLNCFCGSAKAEYKPWPGDVTCAQLPWHTQAQPELLERQCAAFNASQVYALHFGAAAKPWSGWLQEDAHQNCEPHAVQGTRCQSAEWFAHATRRHCFTQQAVLHSYWLCQQRRQLQRLQELQKRQPRVDWQQVDDMDDLRHADCPCVLLQPLLAI